MCTAITYKTKDHYFGRNLDLEYSYHETVTVTPRRFPFAFRFMGECREHYAMIGMAYVADGFPLYYDATNERGLSMAGLNFPGNADYKPVCGDGEHDDVAPFEFIPWVLAQCANVTEARALLGRLNLCREDFSPSLPASPLHWIIADRDEAVVVESVKDGLRVYDDPVGVLTNNPPFDYHMLNLSNYMGVTREEPTSTFADSFKLTPYSRGMGGIGIPGDLSSASRFVRAAFTRLNSVSGDSETESVAQFLKILGSVAQQRGCARVGEKFEITIYSSCCNTDTGVYYYTTYENSSLTAVDMHRENLDGEELAVYQLVTEPPVRMMN